MEFKFKKNYGQNFISDKNLIKKIVSYANITKEDLVIEIGPGAGALTSELLNLAKNAIIYEIDKELEDILIPKLKDYNNYELIFEDFLNVNIKDKIKQYQYNKLIVVANLPYYITTPILKKFIDNEIFPDEIVIMVQKEVANRLSAKMKTKEYGSLTVFLNYFYDVKKVMDVNRKLFYPIPNVDSSVLCLKKHDKYKKVDILKFNKLVKDSFQFKRKSLRNNLKNYDLEKIDEILKKHDLSLLNRAEELDIEIFVEIANNI